MHVKAFPLDNFLSLNSLRPEKYRNGSILLTVLSKATVINMKKNRTAHSCGRGILLMASGYATNASPGPKESKKKVIKEWI